MRFTNHPGRKSFTNWSLSDESPRFGPLDQQQHHRTQPTRTRRKNHPLSHFAADSHSPTVSVISESEMYAPATYGHKFGRSPDVYLPTRNKTQKCGLLIAVLFLAALIFICTSIVLFITLEGRGAPQKDNNDETKGCDSLRENSYGKLQPNTVSSTPGICLEEECIQLAGSYISNMKKEVDPCSDFYEYACGNYGVNRYVPDHETKLNVISEMKAKLNKNLRDLLNSAERKNAGDAMQQMLVYYDSCMDDQAQDAIDLMPLNSLLSNLGGWPLLQNAVFDDRTFAWELLNGHLMTLGVLGLFSVNNRKNLDEHNRNVLMIGNPKLLLGQKRHYSQPFGQNEYVRNYELYMKELISMLGGDEDITQTSIRNVLKFDYALANITNIATSESQLKSKHILSFGDLKRDFPKINFELIFKTGLGDYSEYLTNSTVLSVFDLDYLHKLERMLEFTPPQTLNDYLMWRLISTMDLYLPQRYRVPHENYRSVVYGVTLRPLWEECVAEVQKRMSLPLSVQYAQKYARRERDQQVEHMLAALKMSVEETIMNSDWMDENTRLVAMRKVGSIRYHMGSPSNFSMPALNPGNLNLIRDSFFDNAVQLMRLSTSSEFSAMVNISATSERANAQLVTSPSVDAFYDYFSNELVFTDAMLGHPLVGTKLPPSVNFGALGMAIAHETIHSIDDLGSNYGERGLHEPWWSAEMKDAYNQKKDCFVAQYGSKVEPETERYLDGKLTVSENIADNAGLRIAFNALKVVSNQNWTSANRLPSFENFSDHQMFFLSFANMFCESVKPGSMPQVLNSDSHSIGLFRVNVPLQNFPTFAKTYRCPIGSPMNPYEKCRLW